MALVKGRFVDKDIPIQSNNDPVDPKDLARKSYVDQKAADEAAAAVAALDLSGKADLVDGKVPSSQLPGYVDDVEEYADLASFPEEGSAGKLYVAQDTNKVYRWSGTVYIEISASPGSTDAVPEGSVNLYFTDERAKLACVVDDLDFVSTDTAPSQRAIGEFANGRVSKAGDEMTGNLMMKECAVQIKDGANNTLIELNDAGHLFGRSSSGKMTLVEAGSATFSHEIESSSTVISRGLISLLGDDGLPAIPTSDEQVSTKKYVDDAVGGIDLSGKADVGHTHVAADVTDFASAAQSALAGQLALKQNSLGTGTTSQYLRGDLTWQEVPTSVGIAQTKVVSKGGSDATGDGTLTKPFATIAAAMASITDATPSKRYIIKVEAGAYTEGALTLKPNVFVVGDLKEAVRVTASSVAMDASFNAASSQDHRSGMARIILTGACNFDWAAVTSAAGKLYFTEVSFVSAVTMNGHNNAIAQAQFDSCQFFGAVTISGINVGVWKDNVCFGNITLNQHPNGGMASILNGTGGYCGGTLRLNTTVDNFGRRCSAFLRGMYVESLIVDGISSYADADLVSQGKSTQKLNGGQLIAMSPKINHDLESQMIKPLANNTHNMGDWGKQWFFNFAYVHASAGTDMYLLSAMENYDPAGDSAGRSIFINPDGYGLQANVNGGNIELETAAVSGTGVRGKVQVKARELDMTSAKITNLADGTAPQDAVSKAQLDAAIGALPGGLSGKKEVFTLSATDISNGYVDCAHLAAADTMLLMSGGVVHQEVESYTLSVVGGVTRITFTGDLVAPSPNQLLEGDKVYIQYMK